MTMGLIEDGFLSPFPEEKKSTNDVKKQRDLVSLEE